MKRSSRAAALLATLVAVALAAPVAAQIQLRLDRSGVSTASSHPGWNDYDGRGVGDLAIGSQWESLGSASNAGAVHILYGSNEGLFSTPSSFYTQDSLSIPGVAGGEDHFGGALH